MASRRIKDVAELRVFAHPLRLRLFYALTVEGEATASRLAGLVDESLSLVSYHLRELAKHGFIHAVPGRSDDKREHWWRASGAGFAWSSQFSDDPQSRAASVAVRRQMVAHQISRLERFMDEEPAWGPTWADAAFSSDALLQLTADELSQLHRELQQVVTRWHQHGKSAADEHPTGDASVDSDSGGRQHVMVFLHGFPFRP